MHGNLELNACLFRQSGLSGRLTRSRSGKHDPSSSSPVEYLISMALCRSNCVSDPHCSASEMQHRRSTLLSIGGM